MDVPLDVFLGSDDIPEATEHLTPDHGPLPDPDAIEKAARLIREAKRPAVMAGGGVMLAHSTEDQKRLVEAAHQPQPCHVITAERLSPPHPPFSPPPPASTS